MNSPIFIAIICLKERFWPLEFIYIFSFPSVFLLSMNVCKGECDEGRQDPQKRLNFSLSQLTKHTRTLMKKRKIPRNIKRKKDLFVCISVSLMTNLQSILTDWKGTESPSIIFTSSSFFALPVTNVMMGLEDSAEKPRVKKSWRIGWICHSGELGLCSFKPMSKGALVLVFTWSLCFIQSFPLIWPKHKLKKRPYNCTNVGICFNLFSWSESAMIWCHLKPHRKSQLRSLLLRVFLRFDSGQFRPCSN